MINTLQLELLFLHPIKSHTEMIKLIIFDLDGTLLNTIADLANASNYALTELGFHTHAMNEYHMLVGNGINRLLELALPDEARNAENLQEIGRAHV